jgi:hypothetical protein
MHLDEQPSSSGMLVGGADGNLEIEYSSLDRLLASCQHTSWGKDGKMLLHISHEEINTRIPN